MVREVHADSGEVLDDGDAERGEEVGRSDAGDLEELGGADDTGRKDDLGVGVDGVGSVAVTGGELDAGGGRAVEDNLGGLVAGEDDEVRAVVDGVEVTRLGVRTGPLQRREED